MDPSAAMMMGQQQPGMGLAAPGSGMGMGGGGMGMQPAGGPMMAPPGGGPHLMMGGPGGGPHVPGGIFFKTRICNEFRDGRCRRGDMCKVNGRDYMPVHSKKLPNINTLNHAVALICFRIMKKLNKIDLPRAANIPVCSWRARAQGSATRTKTSSGGGRIRRQARLQEDKAVQ